MKNSSETIIIKSNKIIQKKKGANNLTIIELKLQSKNKTISKTIK